MRLSQQMSFLEQPRSLQGKRQFRFQIICSI
jgi:hypothetical protein